MFGALVFRKSIANVWIFCPLLSRCTYATTVSSRGKFILYYQASSSTDTAPQFIEKLTHCWLRNRPSYLNSEINVTIFTLWNRRALVSLRRMILIQFAGEVSSHFGSKVHGHTARFHITHFITAPLMWNLFSSDDIALYDFVVYWCLENNGATFVICLSIEYLVYIHSWIYVTCQGEGRPR